MQPPLTADSIWFQFIWAFWRYFIHKTDGNSLGDLTPLGSIGNFDFLMDTLLKICLLDLGNLIWIDFGSKIWNFMENEKGYFSHSKVNRVITQIEARRVRQEPGRREPEFQ